MGRHHVLASGRELGACARRRPGRGRLIYLAALAGLLVSADLAAQTLPDTPANRRRGVVGCTQTTSGITCPRRPSTTHPTRPRGPSEVELQQQQDLRFHEYNDRGIEYYRRSEWDRAIEQFRKALEIFPDDPDVRHNLKRAMERRDATRAEARRRTQPPPLPASVVDLTQTRVDRSDPVWIREVQDRSRSALYRGRSEVAARTRSFRMKEPPPPELPMPLSRIRTGDIILIGPPNSVLGAAQGFIQGFAEKRWFGNPKAPVTHALVYIGQKSGVKMYMDNQPGTGPQIISEALFKSRYGGRPLYAARPTLEPDGREMYKAAWEYATANAEARRRGLPGTNYGVFGNGNVVCSESALFAVIRAQGVRTGPGKIFTIDYVGGSKLNPISVTPGDIYSGDGKGYFTVRPLNPRG